MALTLLCAGPWEVIVPIATLRSSQVEKKTAKVCLVESGRLVHRFVTSEVHPCPSSLSSQYYTQLQSPVTLDYIEE